MTSTGAGNTIGHKGGIMEFIQSIIGEHGGLIPLIIAVVSAFLLVLQALSAVAEVLKFKLPGAIGRAAGLLQKILDFLMGNKEHKK